MQGERTDERTVLKVTGADRQKFLQDTVTNDLSGDAGGLVYAAILSPQGKYLFDFFVFKTPDAILIDIKSDCAAAFAQRMNMYKLRADVKIEATNMAVSRGLREVPEGAMPDPRHAALGWRAYGGEGSTPEIDWDAIRVAHVIPETGIELIANETYILEVGFERLNGVDFRKGCYVGQEVTARMKHKTELRKGLAQVVLGGSAVSGAEITRDGKTVGRLHTVSGDKAIAYLRFDRAGEGMQAGGVSVDWRS
ncbi:MAG: folate-binding protein YgfZ [Alphaproteobacteria bacterium]|nr:folate-binding protein YgfZ [Alphaproteobacteria bacterium]